MSKKEYERAAAIVRSWHEFRSPEEARAVQAAFRRFFIESEDFSFDLKRFDAACIDKTKTIL